MGATDGLRDDGKFSDYHRQLTALEFVTLRPRQRLLVRSEDLGVVVGWDA